jgi:hypothetical protein
MPTEPEPGRSKVFAVFETNVAQISLLLKAPSAAEQGLGERIKAQVTKGIVVEDIQSLPALLADAKDVLTLRTAIMRWSIPMLVTFTEAYLQDALTLIVAAAFSPSSFPGPIVEEVTGKWIKGTVRSGNPHQWINQLKRFGASGYPDDLAIKLQKIWDLRHTITHTFAQNVVPLRDFSLVDILTSIVLFVMKTDDFLIVCCPHQKSSASPNNSVA